MIAMLVLGQILTGCVQVNVKRAVPPPPSSLVGTQWRLESLAGRPALDGVEATLEFPEAGRIAGNGSCNRFDGAATITGERMQMGAIAATRMACEPARMDQENRYLAALGAAERIAMDGARLVIHVSGLDQPLTFTRRN